MREHENYREGSISNVFVEKLVKEGRSALGPTHGLTNPGFDNCAVKVSAD